jgi:hypothetical protein
MQLQLTGPRRENMEMKPALHITNAKVAAALFKRAPAGFSFAACRP